MLVKSYNRVIVYVGDNMRELKYKNLKMFAYFTGDYFYTLRMADKSMFLLSMQQKLDLKKQSVYNHVYQTNLKYKMSILVLSSVSMFLSSLIYMSL